MSENHPPFSHTQVWPSVPRIVVKSSTASSVTYKIIQTPQIFIIQIGSQKQQV